MQENCYIVYDSSNDGLIIDPGESYNKICSYIKENNVNPLAILNTHAHYDHIGGVKYLQDELNVPFYLHSSDEQTLKRANLLRILFEGKLSVPIPKIDVYIDQLEDVFLIGDMSIRILHTPGHTPGGICVIIQKNIFSGDTLMKGLVGRTDLPGGNRKHLIASLEKLLNLPGHTIIYPGHGSKTLLKNERDNIIKYLKNQ